MPKFTPGPWIVDLEVSEDGPTVHDFKNGTQLVQTYLGPNVSIIEQRANAALIAAAPEMFEELERLIAFIHEYGIFDKNGVSHIEDIGLDRAELVLAKARGEQ